MEKFAYTKFPGEKLDYIVDWTTKNWLETGETIVTSTWSVETGVTDSDESNTTTTATIFIAGGTLGETYILTNTITTSNAVSRTGVREVHLTII